MAKAPSRAAFKRIAKKCGVSMSKHRGFYVLNAKHETVPADIYEWAIYFEDNPDRQLAKTVLGRTTVSTIFMGMDLDIFPKSKRKGYRPLVFETMVFGGYLDHEIDRYRTYADAMKGHATMVARVKATRAG